MESGAKRIIRYWFPVILVAAAISLLSTQRFGESHTAKIVIPVLHWIFPWASLHTLHLMNKGIRKLGHLTEFGILSILLFRAWRADRKGWCLGWSLITLLIVAAYASLDEIHQIFEPGRGPSPRDVAIDITGAFLAQVAVWWYTTRECPFGSKPQQQFGGWRQVH